MDILHRAVRSVWTLRNSYAYSSSEILSALQAILNADVFEVESAWAVAAAVARARTGRGDFADYLIGELNSANGCRTTATFDRALHGSGLFVAP